MNASAIGMAQFTEVGKTKIYPDAIDSSELSHHEAIRLQCYFHYGSIIVAKLELSIRWRVVDGSVNFIKVCHQEMVVATFYIVNGSPRRVQNGLRQARLILDPC